MPERPDGIAAMRQRISRASRTPPAPRRPAERGVGETPTTPPTPPVPEPGDAPAQASPEPPVAAAGEAPAPPPARPAGAPRRRATRAASARRDREPLRMGPDEAPVNLAIRVRRPLDDRLADLIHELRGRGVRTSKVEMIEMLLWELAETGGDTDAVLERLGRFRTWAPRAAGAALPGA